MKTRLLFSAIFLLSANLLFAQNDIKITWNYEGLGFNEFIARAEESSGVRFFFRDDWVKDLRPDNYPGCASVFVMFDKLFKAKNLYYFQSANGDIIITQNFEIEHKEQTNKEKEILLQEDYSYEKEKQKVTENLFIEIGNPAERDLPGNVNITGNIIQNDTRESLSGVTILVQDLKIGTVSNQYGYFNLNLPRGSHQIQFTFIGMKQKHATVNVYGQGILNIEMNNAVIPLRETIVYAQRSTILQRSESGAVKIDMDQVRFQPTSMGEPDITKSILLVPGILSVGEGTIGFNVRGGSADQNLMLLYGAPVYYPSHFFGFFTSVNADVIKDFTIYKGGIPARYGGRISSVIDINTKEGNKREYMGNAGISPVTTHFVFEGPIKKDTASFILAGRTTYSNWVLKLLDNSSLRNSKASFYDVNPSVSWNFNNKNKIDLSAYLSRDAFKLNSDTLYNYNNNIISARWRHIFSSAYLMNVTLANSRFSYDMSSDNLKPEAFILSHRINTTTLKTDFSLYKGIHEIRYGFEMDYHSLLPGKYLPYNDSSLIKARRIPVERAFESSVYLDDKITLMDFITLNAGLRISTFWSLGPGKVLRYNPELSRQSSSVTDTLFYKNGRIIKQYTGPEIRLSVNFKTSENTSVKVNYNHMYQYLHILSNTVSISPTDTWKLSDYYIKPQIGDQFAAGYYVLLSGGRIEASAEAYFKNIKNMVDFKGTTSLVMNEHIEADLAPVKGKAYGLEFSARKSSGRTRWDIGYTWSRILLKSIGSFPDEIINEGKWFPANYDKPHNLTLLYTFLYSRRLSFSSNFTWSTGRPVTYPITSYYIGDKLVVQYSDRNKYRIPDYIRLDASCTINGNLRSHKIANPHLIISVYNLLGRQNVYSIFFTNNGKFVYGNKLSIFAYAIPSVTFNFDF